MRVKPSLVAILASAFGGAALAAISPEEAAKLGGPEYTETGALRAGNVDGSIPPFSERMPPSAQAPRSAGKFRWGDPYEDEQPLYVIDAGNMERHADKLSVGQQLLLKRFPSYRIEVFPTKRHHMFPEHIRENTKRCATTAELVGDGDGLSGAVACIPFPLPRNGYEVLWNASMQIGAGRHERQEMTGWLVNSNGGANLVSRNVVLQEKEYWDPRAKEPRYYLRLANQHHYPPAKAGSQEVMWNPLRMDQENTRAWLYLPAQRRVRLAPEFSYDNVATNYGGLILYDEIAFWDGRRDRFDFSSFEVKEMVVPFNTQKSHFKPVPEMSLKDHPDPSAIRWELRRVLVLDAPRQVGKRHVYKKKVFYIDQDSWSIVLYDAFDDADRLHRTGIGLPYVDPALPLVRAQSTVMFDLNRNFYGYIGHLNNGGVFPVTGRLPASIWLPDSVAGSGVR